MDIFGILLFIGIILMVRVWGSLVGMDMFDRM